LLLGPRHNVVTNHDRREMSIQAFCSVLAINLEAITLRTIVAANIELVQLEYNCGFETFFTFIYNFLCKHRFFYLIKVCVTKGLIPALINRGPMHRHYANAAYVSCVFRFIFHDMGSGASPRVLPIARVSIQIHKQSSVIYSQ